jgi:hypothetical protein
MTALTRIDDPWSPVPTWMFVWRNGYAPCLSTPALVALRDALRDNDPRLIQGLTCSRGGTRGAWSCRGGCAVGLAVWLGDGVGDPIDIECEFGRITVLAGQLLGDPTAVRYFLGWFDEGDRAEVFAALLPEVERELASRTLELPTTAVVSASEMERVLFDPFA